MSIVLTDDQQKLQAAVRGFFASPDKFLTVDGSAGCGKTFTLRKIYDEQANLNKTLGLIDPSYVNKNLIFTATTNKAVNVLQSNFQGAFIDILTIHSLLSLRPVKGKLVSSYSYETIASVLKNQIVVIDECSMINQELFNIIKGVASHGVKFIFVGDSNQLPPVKSKTVSPVFDVPNKIGLTQVVRQQDKLLLLADSFRKYVQDDVFPAIDVNGIDVLHLPQEEFEAMILADMGKPGWTIRDSRVVAYKNDDVKKYNDLIKKDLTGTSAIVEGELVINNSYVEGNPRVNVATEAEVFVRRVTAHKALVDGYAYDITYGVKDTRVWMPKDAEAMKELQKICRDQGHLGNVAKVLADLRPMYASTIHKAQGSTFKRIYIDLNSIKAVQYYDLLMFKRLLYVAVSRASEQVVFTGDI